MTVSLQKGACTPHSKNTGLQHGSKALLFFLVSFIIFCFVHLIQLLYRIMVKHFPFLIYNYMTKFQIYIHCFVLPPLMERKVKNVHSLFCLTPTDGEKKKANIYIHCFVLPPLMERKVKCIVFLVLLLFLFFLLFFVSSLFLAAISNTLISIQNQTHFLANKSQRTENLKQPV